MTKINPQGITARKNSTRKVTVVARRSTLTDQKSTGRKIIFAQYSQTSPEEEDYQRKHPFTKLK